MNLNLDFITKIGILTPILGPVTLFILSELYGTDTFYGTVVGLVASYLPILLMGVLFSIPITLVLYGFLYTVKKFTKNVLLIRALTLMVGCLLIISSANLFGYNLNETEDCIWPLAYCITLLGLCVFVTDVRPSATNEIRL